MCRGGRSWRVGGEECREHALADKWGFIFGIVVSVDCKVPLSQTSDQFRASRNYGSNTLSEFYHADLCDIVDGEGRDFEDVCEASKTVCLVIVVKGIENLDCRGLAHVRGLVSRTRTSHGPRGNVDKLI